MTQQENKINYTIMNENEIGKRVIDASFRIHRMFGAGLLQPAYESLLFHELKREGLKAKRQVPIEINYYGHKIDEGFKADIIVENKIILKIESVDSLTDIHKKTLVTYLKLTGYKLGFLLNFNSMLMKDGITRIINGKI